jgi:site-specific DNA-cytosine methylase
VALKLREPHFAHIPMILGPDKQRLSKRHGATAVGEYEQQGFLPEAMLNYLALLGWSLDDKTTLISVADLQKHFSLERVTKHPAVFDNTKLEWMNGQYVKQTDLKRVTELAWPHFVRAGLLKDADKAAKAAWFEKLVASLKEKVRTLSLLPERTAAEVIDFSSGNWSPTSKYVPATQVRIADGRRRGWTRFVAPYYGSGSGEIARSLDRPIGTITTLDRWLVVDGDRGRVLTVPEVIDFMSFPRGYYLAGTRRDKIMQLGNAVPPLMAAEVIRQVCEVN